MGALEGILATVLPVFAIMGIGFIFGRFHKIPTQAISDLLMWIFIPCLVLGSLGTQSLEPGELLQIGAAALIVMAGTAVITLVFFFKRPERRALLLSSVFMNSANMAFPLALFAFSEAGLSRQVVFYVAVHVVHVTVGVGLARGKGAIKEVFRLPLVYAAAVAVTLALTGTRLPQAIVEPLDLVGKATIPVMLVILGSRLGSASATAAARGLSTRSTSRQPAP